MAKKEKQLTYGQMPLPEAEKAYKIVKKTWSGLNYRQTIDSGGLSLEENISTDEAPYLTAAKEWEEWSGAYTNPLGFFGFKDFLVVINEVSGKIRMWKIGKDKQYKYGEWDCDDLITQRSVVLFNRYNTASAVDGDYTRKLLVFPDKKSVDFELDETTYLDAENLDVEIKTGEGEPDGNTDKKYYYKDIKDGTVYKWDELELKWTAAIPPSFPPIKYATVHLSRLFGVGGGRVYASGFNDYANWTLDNSDGYNEAHAWCTPSQSNTKAGGDFTGITAFQGHVVCFKKDFMHEIYNTKNPFRLQDIYAEGAIDNRTIQDVDGRLIFVSEDNVKIYTGSNPRIISYSLNMDKYTDAVSGTDGRRYYLYCKDGHENARFFCYDTVCEAWAEIKPPPCSGVKGLAHTTEGMFLIGGDGVIYKQTETACKEWAFETDLMTNETVDIKYIRKLQMLAYLDDNASMRVYILYDDEAFDQKNSHMAFDSEKRRRKGQITVRVKPRNKACYGFKIHVEGSGYVRLHEMELIFEAGGELYDG